MRRFLLGLVCLALGAADPPVAMAGDERPVVLLLSGGGARGAAHVGVLKVLEEEHIPVDLVIGTSMGALVGGMYASGLSAAELEAIVVEAQWADLFRSRPERSFKIFRRKQDELDHLVRFQTRLEGRSPVLPLGAIDGRHITDFLREVTAGVVGVEDFSRLPIPFRAIATDLETGDAVILDRGALAVAMRASMAVPGVFTPVVFEGKVLVDGGIAENLAASVAKEVAGARVIAVDIGSPPLRVDELGSPPAVINQAVTLLMARENRRQRELLGSEDVLITPDLGSFSSAAFSQAQSAIEIGEAAARANIDRLRALAVPRDQYAAWRRQLGREIPSRAVVAAAHVVGPDLVEVRGLRRRLEAMVGKGLDRAAVAEETERVRALDLFEVADIEVVPIGSDRVRLAAHLVPRERGRDFLRYGLRLTDDFAGDTDFDLGLRWVANHVSPADIELRTDLRLGDRQRLIVDGYRPVGRTQRWFVAATAGYREEPFALYIDPTRFIGLRRRDVVAAVAGGLELGIAGELLLGVEQNWSRLRSSSEAGLPVEGVGFDETLAFLRLGIDTFDDAVFPTSGWLVRGESVEVLSSELEEEGAQFGSLLVQRAWSIGPLRMVTGGEVADSWGKDPAFPRARAGGLFRLSGHPEDALRGARLALGSFRVAYPIAGQGAQMPIFVGASFEVGTVRSVNQTLALDDLEIGGAAYLGIDSVLGPVFFYVGLAEDGERTWGFALGRQPF